MERKINKSRFAVIALTAIVLFGIYLYAKEKIIMISIVDGIVPAYDEYRNYTELRGVKHNSVGACGVYNRHNQYNTPSIDLFFFGLFVDGKFKLVSDGRYDDYMITKCGEIGIPLSRGQYILGW